MKRFPAGTTVRVTKRVFENRTGVVLADDWRCKSAPEYQRVHLDDGDEHLLRIDCLKKFEKTGQIGLFGGAA